jgi:hypothetical protein
MKKNNIIISLVVFLMMSLGSFNVYCQKGSFVMPYFGLGFTNFANYTDSYRTDNLKLVNTVHTSYGINYIYNSVKSFGWQAGIKAQLKKMPIRGLILL